MNVDFVQGKKGRGAEGVGILLLRLSRQSTPTVLLISQGYMRDELSHGPYIAVRRLTAGDDKDGRGGGSSSSSFLQGSKIFGSVFSVWFDFTPYKPGVKERVMSVFESLNLYCLKSLGQSIETHSIDCCD